MKPRSNILANVLVIVGIATLLFGVPISWIDEVLSAISFFLGLLLVLCGILIMRRTGKTSKDIDKEILDLSRELQADIGSVSRLVFNELSETHEAKFRPTVRQVVVDFAEIAKTMKGKGIILETIECPHCGAPLSLPKTGESTQCSHCNKTILALDLFERLKSFSS